MAQAGGPRWSLESELLRIHYQALFASSGDRQLLKGSPRRIMLMFLAFRADRHLRPKGPSKMTDAIPGAYQTEPEPTDSNLWRVTPVAATSSQKPTQSQTPPPVGGPVDTVQISSEAEGGIPLNTRNERLIDPVND
jgi:hypothetical protein